MKLHPDFWTDAVKAFLIAAAVFLAVAAVVMGTPTIHN